MRDLQLRSRAVGRVAVLGVASIVALAACAGSGASGWTFAPEPSVTLPPVASGGTGASAAPSNPAPSGGGGASGAPLVSSAPGSSPNPGGSNPTGGGTTGETTVRVAALNIAFDTTTIQAPAGQAFSIEFDNQDASIPHNIDIKDPSGNSVFKGDLVTGPAKANYQVPALTKGTAYTFACDVHPNMTGTVTVQ